MSENSKRILVFTGAGIGVPLGLPTTQDFLLDINNHSLEITRLVISYLKAPHNEDIEWILSGLEKVIADHDFNDILMTNCVRNIFQHESHLNAARQRLTDMKSQAITETSRIKKGIFSRLTQFETKNAQTLYEGLISDLNQKYPNCAISVITTNYDLTFEEAMESSATKIEFGFKPAAHKSKYDSDIDFNWKNDSIEFRKIHGSLDWHRDIRGNFVRSGTVTSPDNPDKMAILYPGFKGVPNEETFVSLHNRLRQRLEQADEIFVIGFAFRDEYICSIFENIFLSRPNIRINYINPLDLDKHPIDSRAPKFASSYRGKFIHIQKKIELSATPLFPGLAKKVVAPA
jgi:hypothetical protein